MIYSHSSFKRKLGLVSLIVLASLASSNHGIAMEDEQPSIEFESYSAGKRTLTLSSEDSAFDFFNSNRNETISFIRGSLDELFTQNYIKNETNNLYTTKNSRFNNLLPGFEFPDDIKMANQIETLGDVQDLMSTNGMELGINQNIFDTDLSFENNAFELGEVISPINYNCAFPNDTSSTNSQYPQFFPDFSTFSFQELMAPAPVPSSRKEQTLPPPTNPVTLNKSSGKNLKTEEFIKTIQSIDFPKFNADDKSKFKLEKNVVYINFLSSDGKNNYFTVHFNKIISLIPTHQKQLIQDTFALYQQHHKATATRFIRKILQNFLCRKNKSFDDSTINAIENLKKTLENHKDERVSCNPQIIAYKNRVNDSLLASQQDIQADNPIFQYIRIPNFFEKLQNNTISAPIINNKRTYSCAFPDDTSSTSSQYPQFLPNLPQFLPNLPASPAQEPIISHVPILKKPLLSRTQSVKLHESLEKIPVLKNIESVNFLPFNKNYDIVSFNINFINGDVKEFAVTFDTIISLIPNHQRELIQKTFSVYGIKHPKQNTRKVGFMHKILQHFLCRETKSFDDSMIHHLTNLKNALENHQNGSVSYDLSIVSIKTAINKCLSRAEQNIQEDSPIVQCLRLPQNDILSKRIIKNTRTHKRAPVATPLQANNDKEIQEISKQNATLSKKADGLENGIRDLREKNLGIKKENEVNILASLKNENERNKKRITYLEQEVSNLQSQLEAFKRGVFSNLQSF